MIEKLQVKPTLSSPYDIVLDYNLDFSNIYPFLIDKQVLVVTNTTLERLYLQEFLDSVRNISSNIKSCVLNDGEIYKSQQSLDKILDILLENKFTRSSTVLIALGGGVIGDITGFAAAIYQRGVDFIQIPTTLLSQIDSSVGGKTAINHSLGKNMIGAFYQPKLVYTSTDFYRTLPQREYIAGMAEVVKYGFISGEFYSWLESNRDKILSKDKETIIQMIKRSCEIKAQIVAEDEKETSGARAVLNFGHTFGHAIEKCQNYQGLKHGEAVGVGMSEAIDFGYFLNLIDKENVQKYKQFIQSFNINIELPKNINHQEYVEAMLLDKKNNNNNLKFILGNVGSLGIVKVSKSKLEDFVLTSAK